MLNNGVERRLGLEEEINVQDKEVKVVLEMPGVIKEQINIQTYQDYVEVSSNYPHRKYQVIEIPHLADIKRVRSTYKLRKKRN